MEDIYTKFTGSILKLNRLVQKIKNYEISKHGLKPIHVSCGYYLNKNPQGLTAKELGELSLEDKAAISRSLKFLQEKGYVKYAPYGHNEIVQLTDEGKKLADYICERVNLAVNACSVSLTDDERSFLYKSLSDVADNLTNYYKNLIKDED
ncbi:MAG: MarR family winged helix-turn-helix transcriptional regulator [Muribaculaceae bacterium]|nr:MarR family winged helix-turn-helix transcriptional regulator [Muribaculaceae bacterium]